jgi:hypothetical protein
MTTNKLDAVQKFLSRKGGLDALTEEQRARVGFIEVSHTKLAAEVRVVPTAVLHGIGGTVPSKGDAGGGGGGGGGGSGAATGGRAGQAARKLKRTRDGDDAGAPDGSPLARKVVVQGQSAPTQFVVNMPCDAAAAPRAIMPLATTSVPSASGAGGGGLGPKHPAARAHLAPKVHKPPQVLRGGPAGGSGVGSAAGKKNSAVKLSGKPGKAKHAPAPAGAPAARKAGVLTTADKLSMSLETLVHCK